MICIYPGVWLCYTTDASWDKEIFFLQDVYVPWSIKRVSGLSNMVWVPPYTHRSSRNIYDQNTHPETPRAPLCLSVSDPSTSSRACRGTPAEPTNSHNGRVMSIDYNEEGSSYSSQMCRDLNLLHLLRWLISQSWIGNLVMVLSQQQLNN